MEPFTLTIAIISMISGSVIIIAGLFAIIKNGKDITEDIIDWVKNRDEHAIFWKGQAFPIFVGICKFYEGSYNRIECKAWEGVIIPDKTGKDKTFLVPEGNKYIEIELKTGTKLTIQSLGTNIGKKTTVIGFNIIYGNRAVLREFVDTALSKFIDKKDLDEFLGPIIRAERIPIKPTPIVYLPEEPPYRRPQLPQEYFGNPDIRQRKTQPPIYMPYSMEEIAQN